ncbi:hypothetical protein GGI07_004004 [Coemansia sp. Benny D115]|nr:hypothetical protein GGI07_004004 [Coemansia sp. Benny D115]
MTVINHKRQQAVRDAMSHAWKGYVDYAYGKDELQPVSKTSNKRWGDWAITLVDSLDSLRLMDLESEYLEAKEFVRTLDFTRTPEGHQLQVFEMTIRALGGLLGAYELDEDPMLLKKAKEVGDILAIAYENSATGLPASSLDVNGRKPVPGTTLCIAEAGTVQLEFKKLSQRTGDPKYHKLAEGATEALENAERPLKGLYPAFINTADGKYNLMTSITMGAYADSFYEYQLKQYILHDKQEKKFKDRYVTSTEAVKEHLVAKSDDGITYLGRWEYNMTVFYSEMEHLACFYPGVLALGAQVLDRPQDLLVAEELARTCYLSYNVMPTGLGPDKFSLRSKNKAKSPTVPADDDDDDEFLREKNARSAMNKYGILPVDPRYVLRPETVESLFVLYRVTGDPKYQEWGWEIFNAIEKYTKIEAGYAAYNNVYDINTSYNHMDSMESFFLAETLKYLYLLFSPTDLLPLDEYVFNTEAHPFKIIKAPEEPIKDAVE